jgi:hypothetical protein
MEWGRRVAEGPRKKAQSAIGKRSPKNGCVIACAKGSNACPMTNSLTRSIRIHPIFTTQGNTDTDKMGFKFPCPVTRQSSFPTSSNRTVPELRVPEFPTKKLTMHMPRTSDPALIEGPRTLDAISRTKYPKMPNADHETVASPKGA